MAAAIKPLRKLPHICTIGQLRGLLSTAAGRPLMAPAVLAAGASATLKAVMRSACASSSSLVCARVAHRQCSLPADLMECEGVALMRSQARPPSQRGREGEAYLEQCITNPERAATALRRHAMDASRSVPGVAALSSATDSLAASRPARFAIAIVDSMRGAPAGRALGTFTNGVLGAVGTAQQPLMLLAVGLCICAVRSIALGGPLPALCASTLATLGVGALHSVSIPSSFGWKGLPLLVVPRMVPPRPNSP